MKSVLNQIFPRPAGMLGLLLVLAAVLAGPQPAAADTDSLLYLNCRTREEVSPGSDRFREVVTPTQWKAGEAAMPVSVDQPSDDDGVIREAVRFFDRQIETLEIHEEDAITDSAEAFYLMKQRGIKNILIMGVHTNMCVLGRPFGIRQMVYQGQNVVLMRDMTDSMYNPRDPPYVNHYTGNDLVFEHIERYWCPTVTSADILGSEPFRFPDDRRKHLVVVMAEDEYETASTLPPFVLKNFGAWFKISYVYARPEDRSDLPGLDVLDDADLAIWSIRRRPLPKEQLDVFRKYTWPTASRWLPFARPATPLAFATPGRRKACAKRHLLGGRLSHSGRHPLMT